MLSIDIKTGEIRNLPVTPLSPAEVLVRAKAAETEQSDAAKRTLERIDLASIRAIREYIVSKPDAPQILKDHEASAALARAKVKR